MTAPARTMAGMPLAGATASEEAVSPPEDSRQARAEEGAAEAASPRELGQEARAEEGAAEAASPRELGQEARAEEEEGGRPSAPGRGATIPVPVVTPHLNVYKLHVSGPGAGTVGGLGRAVTSHLPSAERIAFYGGLGAAAVVGLIEWPVAAAIGLGTAVAHRASAHARPEPAHPEPARPESAQPEAAA